MKIVAITSCPTGIAHSQMAAENLRTTAEDLGHDVSVEVQGAMGTQDELTTEEIAAADAVIIAADTSVNRDRFEDKPLVNGTVKDGVNDAEGLIEQAIELAESGSTAAIEADTESTETETETTEESAADDRQPARGQEQLGGDPSKGLFARLKRFLG
ncbi:PTS fructose transporter subunit IIB [Halalkalicoccus jeotgali]|uniref:Phosphotransferase system IIB component n=1 Tax=Halalkalicoccus jeotgali (strain DSM 18796 / CECT 7217 / JCM 14584 / KCTC 4019 / B3) TaxID=795797 RepID=D8J422_HALJB|nr:PTS fructose transporter subunit IIB [Halalkalicoccus jeotgali]ADJ15414.1 phosphotransferase system IIB component [Halalkalicoccus jeotgali B3]ELY35810.1 phosphotransferase system IIB component [Halalkalicoccus jeotgali B3]